MTASRRMGTENSRTRLRLLDITERLMLKEGYASVGIRRVAREADVAPALVLYYFRTLDDLFLAVLRRRAEQEREISARVLDSPQPLHALWELSSQPGAALITEFMALANHRKAIHAELAAHAERYRRAQEEIIVRKAAEGRLSLPDVPPVALLVVTTALARVLVMEKSLGMTAGHTETLDLVERVLRRIEGTPEPGPGHPADDHTTTA
ncbi:TetR/AcrR family transcriptional regulator [Streptomyces sp. NPDC001508]|uniref:TetR/AcrR family transcriptional regulator n=1 Tax=Streptomyces sp. NPDC001508 TaxID=3154656 RepID=UPI00332EF9A8